LNIDKAWKFDSGQWEIIDDIRMLFCYTNGISAPEEMFYLTGYNYHSSLTLGIWGLPFYIDVHTKYSKTQYKGKPVEKALYPYYVAVFFADHYESIYVVDFPSLLILLSQVSTIIGQAEQLYRANETVED
jgi:hypothetical protein